MNKNQVEFLTQGFTVIDDFFPVDVVTAWKNHVYALAETQQEGVKIVDKTFSQANLEARDSAGRYKFVSINGLAAFKMDGVEHWYNAMSKYLSLFTGLDIVGSWDKQSSVTFMKYDAPGGGLVHHFDSNFITFLLYLTDNPEEGATDMLPISALFPTNLGQPDEKRGESVLVYPKFNRVVIFQGRKVWHSSQPVFKDTKISSVWNFYERGDTWRPKDVSERLYK
jgi:hypothetical protein